MKIHGIIPSRYASSRFPGKPLVEIGGKTMIRRVYEQASKAKSLTDLLVATDDERIFNEIKSFGGNVRMTSVNHNNGTERCAEIAHDFEAGVIINIQGDEPFIEPEQIDLLAQCFSLPETQIATLIKEHPLNDDLQNPSRVKVVLNNNMEVLYFSRSVIPYRTLLPGTLNSSHVFYKHIGIYAYRKEILLKIVKLPPSLLEIAESLEQLRWLQNDYKIKCVLTSHDSLAIDTPEDLKNLNLK